MNVYYAHVGVLYDSWQIGVVIGIGNLYLYCKILGLRIQYMASLAPFQLVAMDMYKSLINVLIPFKIGMI